MTEIVRPGVSLEAARLACEWQHEFGQLLLDEAEKSVIGKGPLKANDLQRALPNVISKISAIFESKSNAHPNANREAA